MLNPYENDLARGDQEIAWRGERLTAVTRELEISHPVPGRRGTSVRHAPEDFVRTSEASAFPPGYFCRSNWRRRALTALEAD